MSFLKLNNISFVKEDKQILKNIKLEIEKGDFLSIVGPSGSGKSTLLKLCCDLISPTEGNITFMDKDIAAYNPVELRKKINYCFQTPYLFGETVMDNLSFPYIVRKDHPDLKRINELLAYFNIPSDFINKSIKNLSGGEKQRIALIRSMIYPPDILLLDEVTASLDADNTNLVEEIIHSINKKGTTILWITHNLEQSRRHSNKLLSIDHGEIISLEVLK